MQCQQDPQTRLIVRQTRTSSFGLRPAPRRVWCVSVFLTLSYLWCSCCVSHLAAAEAIRASCQAAARHALSNHIRSVERAVAAELRTNYPLKRRERSVGQYAGPISKRTICRSDTRKPSGSRRTCPERPPMIHRASRRRGTTDELLCKPPGGRRASAIHRAIC